MTPQLNIQQNGDRHDVRCERAHAVAHQRQRDTCNWHNPHGHPDIDEDVKRDHRGDSDCEQTSEHIARILRDTYPAPQNNEVEEEQNRTSDEAKLLSHNRKDEVRVVLRQEIQLALRPAEQSLAEEHP